MTQTINEIPVDEIKPFLDRQSRKDEFERLKNSISKHGVLVPIQVTAIMQKKRGKARKKKSRGKHWMYQLVWGHRRLRAAKETGLKTIPATMVPTNDIERVKNFFIENEARKQLTAYEVALLMEADRGILSISEIAQKYSMSDTTVRASLRTIENASPALRKHLKTGRFSMTEARCITTVSDHKEQTVLVNRALQRGLSGRKLKDEVKSIRSDDDSITTRSVQAKQRALLSTLKDAIDERNKILERYELSVVALSNALAKKGFRSFLDKRKVDYTPFWNQ
jgi:ParB family chromosome partitioning protein